MVSDFPCGSADKEFTCNVGDLGSIPGLGRTPGEGKGYLLQYSIDYTVCRVAESQTQHSEESDTTQWLSLSFYIQKKKRNEKKPPVMNPADMIESESDSDMINLLSFNCPGKTILSIFLCVI